jgi:hypothetical protein
VNCVPFLSVITHVLFEKVYLSNEPLSVRAMYDELAEVVASSPSSEEVKY